MLQLEPTARAKRLLKDLPAFLEELEGKEITEIPRQRRRHGSPRGVHGRSCGCLRLDVAGRREPAEVPGAGVLHKSGSISAGTSPRWRLAECRR